MPSCATHGEIRLLTTARCRWLTNAVNPQQIVYKDEFLREHVQIYPTDLTVKKTVHHMGPGVHEWNFKFTLRGSLPESVEGLAGSYIVYNLHATMDRGMMAKTLYADKHLRIIRTLASEILSDAAMEQVHETLMGWLWLGFGWFAYWRPHSVPPSLTSLRVRLANM